VAHTDDTLEANLYHRKAFNPEFLRFINETEGRLAAGKAAKSWLAEGAVCCLNTDDLHFDLSRAPRGLAIALATSAAVVLALLPKGFTALSGISFPSGPIAGVLVFLVAALLLCDVAGF